MVRVRVGTRGRSDGQADTQGGSGFSFYVSFSFSGWGRTAVGRLVDDAWSEGRGWARRVAGGRLRGAEDGSFGHPGGVYKEV